MEFKNIILCDTQPGFFSKNLMQLLKKKYRIKLAGNYLNDIYELENSSSWKLIIKFFSL